MNVQPPCVPAKCECQSPYQPVPDPACPLTIWAHDHATCNDRWDGVCHVADGGPHER